MNVEQLRNQAYFNRRTLSMMYKELTRMKRGRKKAAEDDDKNLFREYHRVVEHLRTVIAKLADAQHAVKREISYLTQSERVARAKAKSGSNYE